jgi:glycine/D-amino acid oxidase-like deaminating enzyme
MNAGADIVVIGGGCEGTSIAWQLAKRKAGRVVLLEKRGIASGATGWSSAIIRTHYAHEALARMALHGLRTFESFRDIVGGEGGFRRTGFLVLLQKRDAATARASVAMHRSVGVNTVFLGGDEFHHIEPRTYRDDIGAVVWEPESGHADPATATASFADAARREGVDIRVGVAATAIRAPKGRVEGVYTSAGPIAAGTVVVAANYRTRELLAPLGVDLPLTPVRHSIAVVERTAGFGPLPPVLADRINGAYHRPEGASLTLIGNVDYRRGEVDEDVEAARPGNPEDVRSLAARYARRWRGQDTAKLVRSYTGVYDCSPDLQPALGPVRGVDGLHVAAGFSGHGFKLSPAVGEMVSAGVVGEASKITDIALFDVHRFADRRPIVGQYEYSK